MSPEPTSTSATVGVEKTLPPAASGSIPAAPANPLELGAAPTIPTLPPTSAPSTLQVSVLLDFSLAKNISQRQY